MLCPPPLSYQVLARVLCPPSLTLPSDWPLLSGVGGDFHLINKYSDNLTFKCQPFVWHFFLSHIQRESSDICGLLVSRMQERSCSGRRVRTWYDNKAAAIINKDAMELGVEHSRVFVLVLSPSVFKSPYVKFEILVGEVSPKAFLFGVSGLLFVFFIFKTFLAYALFEVEYPNTPIFFKCHKFLLA